MPTCWDLLSSIHQHRRAPIARRLHHLQACRSRCARRATRETPLLPFAGAADHDGVRATRRGNSHHSAAPPTRADHRSVPFGAPGFRRLSQRGTRRLLAPGRFNRRWACRTPGATSSPSPARPARDNCNGAPRFACLCATVSCLPGLFPLSRLFGPACLLLSPSQNREHVPVRMASHLLRKKRLEVGPVAEARPAVMKPPRSRSRGRVGKCRL